MNTSVNFLSTLPPPAVLVIYLTSSLIGWDDDLATAVYHAFTVLAYLFPLLGAMIADSWWGKYW